MDAFCEIRYGFLPKVQTFEHYLGIGKCGRIHYGKLKYGVVYEHQINLLFSVARSYHQGLDSDLSLPSPRLTTTFIP